MHSKIYHLCVGQLVITVSNTMTSRFGPTFWLDFSSEAWCNMDCTGLALSWEQNPDGRSLVRKNQKLLVYPKNAVMLEPTRSNCIENAHMLRPLIHKLSRTPSWHLPHLEGLQIELALLSEKLGVRIGDKGVYAPAVELKKLLSFVKRRVRRKEVTKEWG